MLGTLRSITAGLIVLPFLASPLHGQTIHLTEALARSPEERLQAYAHQRALSYGPLAKIGAILALLHEEYETYREEGARVAFRPTDTLVRVTGDRVAIDAIAEADAAALRVDLEGLGLEGGATFGRFVSGTIPITALDEVAALGSLRFAQPVMFKTRALSAEAVEKLGLGAGAPPRIRSGATRPIGRTGMVTSQGDRAQNSDLVRNTFALSATVQVGAISDTYDCLDGAAADISSGDLPSNPVIPSEGPCNPGTDEGRALMQIIHDVAPAADLYFHTGSAGQADFAAGIVEMEQAGVDVIVDDVIYFAEPFFADGIIAQAVDSVTSLDESPGFPRAGDSPGTTSNQNVFYVSANGNSGTNTYANEWRNSLTTGFVGQRLDFDPGPGIDQFLALGFPPAQNGSAVINCQWNNPYASTDPGSPGAETNVDTYLYDAVWNLLGGTSTNNIGGDPTELLSVTYSSVDPFTVHLAAEQVAGPDLTGWSFQCIGLSDLPIDFEYQTRDLSTSFGHPNAKGANSVGASAWFNTPNFGVDPPIINTFSSWGGTGIRRDGLGAHVIPAEIRTPPDITAPDGGNTTHFGSDSPTDLDTYPNFFGTSASAPHAAAAAALLLQGDPTLPPNEIAHYQRLSAVDMDDPTTSSVFDDGYDSYTGAGLSWSFGANNLSNIGFGNPLPELKEIPPSVSGGLDLSCFNDGTCNGQSTDPFFGIGARMRFNRRDANAPGAASATWTNDRGGSGTGSGGPTDFLLERIPLQAGVNRITVTLTDDQGRQQLGLITVTVNELLYYLAEGATGPFFDYDLLLGNPHPVQASITITFLKEDGSTVVLNETLAANSQRTIRVNDVAGLAALPVSAVVASNDGLALSVERSMFWNATLPAPRDPEAPVLTPGTTHYGGHTAKAVDSPRTTWFFAEGSQGFFDTYLLLANPGATAATATVTYLLEGAAPVVQVVPVGATSRVTLFAGTLPALVGRSFGIQVTATQPIIAERAMYFTGTGRFYEGGHESAGVPDAATSWFLAEGATGSFFDNFILVSNPNGVPANLTVTFLLDSGVAIPTIHQVPANARITINVETQDAQLASANVSTTVTSDVPVIAERAMYWSGGFTTWYEAHNAFDVTATGTKWGLAEGRVGAPFNHQTFILLANPSGTAATVRITYLRTNGTTVVKTYTVAGTSRKNVWVNAEVPELVNEGFGALIEVTNGVEIAVERALYWDNGAQVFGVGTNATAIRLP